MSKVKVCIVEDSKLMQELLQRILKEDDDIEIVGVADDPLTARELIKKARPDVITLDIMLPHMDGITFLKNLMRLHPIPVVMLSNLTQKNSEIALEALAYGAVDYLPKPTQHDMKFLDSFSKDLISTIKEAAKANVARNLLPLTESEKLKKIILNTEILQKFVIGIGASTGGIEAIETILLQLPKVMPPIVIVQHIRKEFSTSFSQRLNRLYGLIIHEVTENMELFPGQIYIASGASHVAVIKKGSSYFARPDDSPAVNRHKPSVDVLFHSLAKNVGDSAVGVLLTGMGSDGAIGLKAMRDAGARTIAQDESSSVVWGMPGTAVKMDAADYVVSLNEIPKTILGIMDEKMLLTTKII